MPHPLTCRRTLTPPTPTLSICRTGPYGPENRELMRAFKTKLKACGLYGPGCVIFAAALDDPAATPPERCRYQLSTPAPADGRTYGLEAGTLPGGAYAVLLLEHTPQAVQAAWTQYLSSTQAAGFRPDPSRPVLERYAKVLVDRHLCQLCVPILP